MMKKDLPLQRHRLYLISVAFMFIATFLGIRLLQKEVIQHPTYRALAKQQQFQDRELPGKRGQILVKDGQGKKTYPAATNHTTYALNVVPSQISDKRKVSESLSLATDIAPDKIFEQINNTKLYIPPIKRNLSYNEAEKVKNLEFEGVYLTSEQTRFYPEDGVAAQVLGFVNNEGKGQYGIEGYFDEILAPKKGSRQNAQDAAGDALALGGTDYTPPEDGNNIVLTIDRNIQYHAEQALDAAVKKFSATGGSVIVMDPKTGAITAMVSRPNFDPNRFGAYPAESYQNQGVSGSYEPGSTFKTIAMSSALDSGAVTPNTVINGTASIRVSDRDIYNAERRPYGRQTMTQVIEHSDNVGMVLTERALGHQRYYDYIKQFGFGVPTGIQLDGEVSPSLRPIDQYGEVDFATLSFGQGISVTPIQLITAMNALANQGKIMQPYIVDQVQYKDGKVEATQPKLIRQVVSPQAASQITGMMVRVVEAGSGKPAKIPGYRIAGKTGTAQIAAAGGYEANTTIGNFVGFAPAEDPKFIMLVKIDRPKGVIYAEDSAVPIFAEVAKYLLSYYNVPPR